AGLWGWKLNEDVGPPHYEEAKQLSDDLAATSIGASHYRDRSGQGLDWWRRHGAESVLPQVSNNLEQWEGKISDLRKLADERKTERARKERELKAEVADCYRKNRAGLNASKKKVEELTAQIADYKNQIAQAEANGDDAWKAKVLVWLDDAERNLARELENVKYYESALGIHEGETAHGNCGESASAGCKKWQCEVESRIKAIDAELNSNEALSNWYHYKIRWARKLYQEFWKAELEK
ncbi:MAG TPA: hypothetical protein VD861_19360, partial [Pyrinomonadaceae bacterium]|nr:hypothetical protein [Pyrinomonadaceae bacterium]